MQEQLLGYLLGALDPPEHDKVADELRRDSRLRGELHVLQSHVERLHVLRVEHAAPADLAQRVCAHVEAHDRPCRAASVQRRGWSVPLTRGWTLADALVAVSVLVVGAVLLVPAVANSRYLAQLAACQNNLRQLGSALHQYSELHGGNFPPVAAHGKLAAAGMYAPALREHELISESKLVVCPASDLARELADGALPFEVPMLRELELASGRRFEVLRDSMGGSYAYTIGFVSDGVYRSPRNLGRSHFPILADAPAVVAVSMQSPHHGGRGQNVLFEDSHVRFVRGCTADDCDDHIFLNRNGVMEAGLDENDAVLAPSGVGPFSADR